MKHWKHFITYDFHHFQAADPLIPDELFESHGCYSGGALLWQDQIVAFILATRATQKINVFRTKTSRFLRKTAHS